MWYPGYNDLELVGYYDANYRGYKLIKRVYVVLANFFSNLFCHSILRSQTWRPYPLSRLNIILLKHVMPKYHGLAIDSKTFEYITRRFMSNVVTTMLSKSLRI